MKKSDRNQSCTTTEEFYTLFSSARYRFLLPATLRPSLPVRIIHLYPVTTSCKSAIIHLNPPKNFAERKPKSRQLSSSRKNTSIYKKTHSITPSETKGPEIGKPTESTFPSQVPVRANSARMVSLSGDAEPFTKHIQSTKKHIQTAARPRLKLTFGSGDTAPDPPSASRRSVDAFRSTY